MPIDITPFRNKQRILITGNHGLDKITQIVRAVLDTIGKPYDYMDENGHVSNGGPIIIYKGGSELEGEAALFHQLEPHIMLLHGISDKNAPGYTSFEKFVSEFEKLADRLPKAGSIIYNENDDISTIIGKNERVDVKSIEYSTLKGQPTNSGFLITHDQGSFEVVTSNENFLNHGAGARALLKRIGVSDEQFYSALKKL